MMAFNYKAQLSAKTTLAAGSHQPFAVHEWRSFYGDAASFLATIPTYEESAEFAQYIPCQSSPLSEDTCLFLCDEYNFKYANQLTSAAGMPGLEFSVHRSMLPGLKSKCE